MGYAELALAIAFELIGTTFLKKSNGFSELIPSAVSVCAYFACYYFFGKCTEKIKLTVAYSTWCAVGIVASALISTFYFHETLKTTAWVGVALLCLGICLTNYTEPQMQRRNL